MRRRAPTSAGGGGVPGRDARPSQGAATQPDVLRRRDVMAAGAPDGVVSRADSFRLAGRLVRRRGAAAARAAPKHGRCGRRAAGGAWAWEGERRAVAAPLGGRALTDENFCVGVNGDVTEARHRFYATSLEFGCVCDVRMLFACLVTN